MLTTSSGSGDSASSRAFRSIPNQPRPSLRGLRLLDTRTMVSSPVSRITRKITDIILQAASGTLRLISPSRILPTPTSFSVLTRTILISRTPQDFSYSICYHTQMVVEEQAYWSTDSRLPDNSATRTVTITMPWLLTGMCGTRAGMKTFASSLPHLLLSSRNIQIHPESIRSDGTTMTGGRSLTGVCQSSSNGTKRLDATMPF